MEAGAGGTGRQGLRSVRLFAERGAHHRTGDASFGKPLSARNAQNRWKAAIKCLGAERVDVLSIHCGRNSFCSHALAGGRSIAEVRDAAGRARISTTSIYLHCVMEDDEETGDLFNFTPSGRGG